MTRNRSIGLVAVAVLGSLFLIAAGPDDGPPAAVRSKADTLKKQGNFKEAYELYRRLAVDPKTDSPAVCDDLDKAIECLRRLGRVNEVDAFREEAIAAHTDDWRLLWRAARSYLNVEHYGAMIAGEFKRGRHRGGRAKWVNAFERDRVRALQLMQPAMAMANKDQNHAAVSEFYMDFARQLLANRGFSQAWRLQYLTDLSTLPDYEDGYYGRWEHGGSRGAPVDENGRPVFHRRPKSWQDAQTDGQRWRWCLLQAMEMSPARTSVVKHHYASFLHHQFGVQTMREYSWFFGRRTDDDDTRKDTSGTWELHTLGEDETIAKLASGIQRFKLPDEFNFIQVFREVAEAGGSHASSAMDTLCGLFENRRQYPKAAELWRQNIKTHGPGNNNWRQKRLDQIVGNWGMFEPIVTQPAGQGASVEYRFRNATRVQLTAHAIDVPKLLADVKAYLKSNPKQLAWERVNIENIGYRLVQKNQKQYVGDQVADWSLDLEPRPQHFDKRVTVATPLQKPGAYLLRAALPGGNVSEIVIWVADTAIVKKPLDAKTYYFIADAVTGTPVAKANVEFFGYDQNWIRNPGGRGGHYDIRTTNFAEFTDADGQLIVGPNRQSTKYRWVVIATTPAGRLAYIGFSGAWHASYYDREYRATKVFVMTDRPVYRPEHTVKFKLWVNHAKYDLEGKSAFAGRKFTVRINNPKGEKVLEQVYTADDFGGFDGELTLPKDATLGVYHVGLVNPPANTQGGGRFRVEEYKKPEFEVTVEAPDEPVMLGEKIEAKVTAKYYFGAPVTRAKVKYKVLRTSHSAQWFPPFYWDWFYGPGYWWFAYDYTWYPGWKEWGCERPLPMWWWRWNPRPQPELVADAEAEIGRDGTFTIAIDTAVAKAIHPDTDHKYSITVEVTDQSRRTIVGTGDVLVARKPFKVYAWVDRGHYRVGDTVRAHFKARRLDGKPVGGTGVLKLYEITYKDHKPVETELQSWKLDTNEQGAARQQINAHRAGQFRLSYTLTDAKDHAIEGGYVFCVRGAGFDGSDFRFNAVEIIPDKAEYKPGETINLMLNTNRRDSTVLLFLRAANGAYLPPKVLRLKGKSVQQEVEVLKKDMPNFFIEAVTVADAKVHRETREIVVPPEDRVLDVQVTPSAHQYKPGAPATVKIKLTEPNGEPFSGSVVVSVYDKAVEYISGGSNVAKIKEFFWKWRRRHYPRTETNLDRGCGNLTRPGAIAMAFLGVFGHSVADEIADAEGQEQRAQNGAYGVGGGGRGGPGGMANRRKAGLAMDAAKPMAPRAPTAAPGEAFRELAKADADGGEAPGEAPGVEPTVRTQFADTALWVAALTTGANGEAEVKLTMPENLTTWKTKVWAMGAGTRCGEGSAEVVTTKNLIIRLQAPRFFVQTDEVVLSANVHNYLKNRKTARVSLELGGGCLEIIKGGATRSVAIDADGEARVDWRVKVLKEGTGKVTMKAVTDEESDAMAMEFPVYVHGMLKTESFSGALRPEDTKGTIAIDVPAERRPAESRLEVRYSPTLAAAMVDALPYMAEYPYGCTEQTLNRFLPTVITQKVLIRMGFDLKDIKQKRTNLNAQEIGDDVKRMHDWQRLIGEKRWDGEQWVPRNPVFDEAKVKDMVQAGLEQLASMQCADGGWGWFSGWGERSYPHTTAVVVHGLQIARANDVAIVPDMINRGVAWLKRYQQRELTELRNAAKKIRPWKEHADNIDALVYMVLVDEKADNQAMREFLYRDRNHLSVYAKAMFGLACHTVGDAEKRDMLIRNVEQYLVQDDENQTAWLKLPNVGYWWYWYGSEYEAHAYYLKLLAATDPKGRTASRLVKYLLNNRRHATYWKSTRDTALVIEAFADFIKASGEDKPDLTVELLIDGKKHKEVRITGENLFSFDNKLVLVGDAVTTGKHTVELRKKGAGPLYYNAYLTNFTLEDPITKAGLEIKVERRYFKLVPIDKTVKVAGSRGQPVDQRVEKYERKPLDNLDMLTSGDLVEIELVMQSKNDYEYIVFEDMKPAGFEPVAVRSGYGGNEMGAYMELRDERVVFFLRTLARGKHSLSYRMRAEIPGKFSALPTRASAMYAPELKANSDEIKLQVKD